MDTMKIIYKILQRLEKAMDEEKLNWHEIDNDALEISEFKWSRIIGMMLEEGLIDGFVEVPCIGHTYLGFKAIDPRITLYGLRYLTENSTQAKLFRAAKELKDLIPGL